MNDRAGLPVELAGTAGAAIDAPPAGHAGASADPADAARTTHAWASDGGGHDPYAAHRPSRYAMRSLRARVLALVAGFGIVTAAALAVVMYTSVRSYYTNVVFNQSGAFIERILAETPDLWAQYESDRRRFTEQLRGFTLFSPSVDLYLLDNEGHVLASSGEERIYWSRYRVDLAAIVDAIHLDPDMPLFGDDPESEGKTALVALRPVIADDQQRGWLYVVARSAHIGTQMPEMLRSHAIRTAVKVGLLTLAIGVLLTMAMLAIFTKPLIALTRAADRVKRAGFEHDMCERLDLPCERNDEIGRLSRTFRDMIERLKHEMHRVRETDASRREMVSSVSHDLRTPLTALIGQLETVRMKEGTLSPDEQRQFIDSALANAQHLQRLTDWLAELAKLDSPDIASQAEPIAIGELADDVVQRYASRAREAGVALGVEYPDKLPLATVDAALVERALANLLDNALRVTPAGGAVTVRVVPNAREMRIEVSDTGTGVAEEDRARVFERFFQGSRHREHRGSSGLGLAIVKRVAELHGGAVGLDSPPGRGATFWLTLPMARASTPAH